MTGVHDGDGAPGESGARARPARTGRVPAEFVSEPVHGRVFTASRTVRATETAPTGRLRFDALARYLQDVAEDDLTDTHLSEPYGWLLRRCAITIRAYPEVGATVRLRTFCSALGPRWAERTTTLTCAGRDLVQATAVWVAIEATSGRPAPLSPAFHQRYGRAARRRRVSARLTHPAPPHAAAGRPWPLRASDFDTALHVNNAVHWAAVEDVLATGDWLPDRAELEYHRPILSDHQPTLVVDRTDEELRVWLVDHGHHLASAHLT